MKLLRVTIVLACVLALGVLGSAQSVDAFFGFNTIKADHNDLFPYMGGGFFPSVGADLILFDSPTFGGVGFGGEVAWRGKVATYSNLGFVAPVRPILYDFGLVWQPLRLPRIIPTISVGFGGESLRVYTPYFQCGTFTGCTDYNSSNHLLGHLGIGVRLYATSHVFLEPSADLYVIRHNIEFGVPSARRFGLTLGYTLSASPM